MAETFIELELKPYQLFDFYISGHGHTNKYIADCLNVSPSLISKIRSNRIALSEKMRQKINELLETDY